MTWTILSRTFSKRAVRTQICLMAWGESGWGGRLVVEEPCLLRPSWPTLWSLLRTTQKTAVKVKGEHKQWQKPAAMRHPISSGRKFQLSQHLRMNRCSWRLLWPQGGRQHESLIGLWASLLANVGLAEFFLLLLLFCSYFSPPISAVASQKRAFPNAIFYFVPDSFWFK